MRRWIWTLALFAALGCGKSGPPTGTAATALDVAAFKGGYDTDFYVQAGKEFQEKTGVEVLIWGSPRVWEQLRPRFVGGTPPDLVFPGWGMDHWALVAEGQLMALDEALDGKPYEGEGTWRDTFDPNLLKLCQQDGKTWMLPYYMMVYGWWHNPDVFTANGWAVPKTWDELLALCEKMKAKGIAPITFQGQYPYYMIDGMLLPWAMSVGGKEAVDAAQSLEPGAWSSPAMLRAAEMIDELNKRGYLQKGAVAMSHTEAQMQFLLGKAGMVPCGSWLSSEMAEQTKTMSPAPKMEFFLPPAAPGGKGDPSTVLIGIEPWMVPSKARQPDKAIEFFKYMTSVTKARQFVEQKGTLMSVKGSDEGVALPEVLVKPAAAVKAAKSVWAVQYRQWYPAFNKEVENALTAMLNGEITPKAFCDRVERVAEAVRRDETVTKHKVAG
jgi:N-acetylglucosamine transport system substrate-binding protein